MMNRVGRGLRDRARKNITDQAYEGRKWEPLSPWTRARTGRFKALITERNAIVHKVEDRGATLKIGYNQRDPNWNLSKHHRGYTNPPSTGLVRIQLKRPGIVGLSKAVVFFSRTKATKVPARPIWPGSKTIVQVARPIVSAWMKENIELARKKK